MLDEFKKGLLDLPRQNLQLSPFIITDPQNSNKTAGLFYNPAEYQIGKRYGLLSITASANFHPVSRFRASA